MPDNGWTKWENHVLLQLKANREEHGIILKEIVQIGKDVSTLKVKAGVWGLVGGMIPTIGLLLFVVLRAKGL